MVDKLPLCGKPWRLRLQAVIHIAHLRRDKGAALAGWLHALENLFQSRDVAAIALQGYHSEF